jgi:hypothetical protein
VVTDFAVSRKYFRLFPNFTIKLYQIQRSRTTFNVQVLHCFVDVFSWILTLNVPGLIHEGTLSMSFGFLRRGHLAFNEILLHLLTSINSPELFQNQLG